MTEAIIVTRQFKTLDIDDPFFTTLKESYSGFVDWFTRKADETAYVSFSTDRKIQAFLYLKVENGPITDINPPINVDRCLKVGTFKIIAHGTKLGERFVKLIVDTVLQQRLKIAYLTIFPQHKPLIRILETFGFRKYGSKDGMDGSEDVYVKDMQYMTGNRIVDYPVIDSRNCKKWLMSIYSDFHTQLFPDSILKTENPLIIQDTSYTNSIRKVYIGAYNDFPLVSPGDCLVIYRCVERNTRKSAWYGSVATSLCVVEEIMATKDFESIENFIDYSKKYSVFTESKLRSLYEKSNMHVVLMTYNLAFPKRPNLGSLVEENVVPHPNTGCYMGFMRLSDSAFNKILTLGGICEGFVIN